MKTLFTNIIVSTFASRRLLIGNVKHSVTRKRTALNAALLFKATASNDHCACPFPQCQMYGNKFRGFTEIVGSLK